MGKRKSSGDKQKLPEIRKLITNILILSENKFKSQAEFAKEIGVSRANITHLKKGSDKISLATVIKAARALNVSLDRLIKDEFGKDGTLVINPDQTVANMSVENLLSLIKKCIEESQHQRLRIPQDSRTNLDLPVVESEP